MTQPRFILLLMGQLKVLSHKYVHTAYTSTLHIKAMGAGGRKTLSVVCFHRTTHMLVATS